VFRYSLREVAAVLTGASLSFAIGFIPAGQFGFWRYFFTIVSAVTMATFVVAHYFVARFAITIGMLFSMAAALGVLISLPSHSMPPHLNPVRGIAILLAVVGAGPMFIAIPLTLHRRTNQQTDSRSRRRDV
jgi:hypothetical protein